MERKMLCFQCEQSAGSRRCTGAEGICGKKADVAGLQDRLIGVLIGLARAADANTRSNDNTYGLLVKGLLMDVTNANCDGGAVQALIDEVHGEKQRLVPDCAVCASPCGRNNDFDVADLYNAEEDVRSLKSLILFGIRDTAVYAHNTGESGNPDKTINELIAKALFAIGDAWSAANLLAVVQEISETNSKYIEKNDSADTVVYEGLVPGTVPLMVEEGSYVSPNVRDELIRNYSITPILTSQEDIDAIPW